MSNHYDSFEDRAPVDRIFIMSCGDMSNRVIYEQACLLNDGMFICDIPCKGILWENNYQRI